MTIKEAIKQIYKGRPHGLTADEAAAEIGESVLSVRPAVTKLRNQGYLKPTGMSRKNLSGQWAVVLKLSA